MHNNHTVCYEQPLNERIRTLLRLEFLFKQVTHGLRGESHWDTRAALQGLFEIMDVTGRTELRTELIKELERYLASLGRLRQTPGVDEAALEAILGEIGAVSTRLRRLDSEAIEAVRQNPFLSAIRQRSGIPGGTCRFDLPALHRWLQAVSEERGRQLEDWTEPFRPIHEGLGLVLRLIRSSAMPDEELALHGFFQKTLDNSAPNQLVRVFLPMEAVVFPEISGGRHRVSIRFMAQPDPGRRPWPTGEDVAFRLACCVI